MPKKISAREAITPEFISDVCHRLKKDARVRRSLPGGRLHIEGALPFLVVYRARENDLGTGSLVRAAASYLEAPTAPPHSEGAQLLLDEISQTLSEKRGALLIIEVWTSEICEENFPRDLLSRTACFRVLTSGLDWHSDQVPTAALHLHEALSHMELPGFRVGAELVHQTPAPPAFEPLLAPEIASERSALVIGLEVPSIFREAPNGPLYPAALWHLRRQLSRVLESTFGEFMRVQNVGEPGDFRALGRSAPVAAMWNADRDLTNIGRSFNLLLSVTPLNSENAWDEFRKSRYKKTPNFQYRLLPFDPDLLKRQLYKIKIEEVEDPALQHLLRSKRIELDRQITLLEDRDTPRFLPGSMALYGQVEDDLLQLARHILEIVPPGRVKTKNNSAPVLLQAPDFAALAEMEIARLRQQYPACKAKVEIRHDVPGIMVVSGDLLVGQSFTVSAERAPALLAHEVGTHVVTYANGRAQKLQILASGLPGYDALQEGTALLAEYLVGGFEASRLRYLAARVVAAHSVEHGATFSETFRLLDNQHNFSKRSAWNVTMRVHRSGGFTKDAVYLRGLVQLLNLLADKSAPVSLDLLWSGKISLDEIEIVRELFLRNILRPNVLRPAFLDNEDAKTRLKILRGGATVLDLLS